jgi:mannose-1-phosphate guanylyltransferase
LMRALLLAAGLGTRLRPITNTIPKCLVPIHGRPLLDYWLENLLDHGIDSVLINTHYLAPMVQKYLYLSSWKSRVTIVHEELLLGTGGTILENRSFFQDEPFLVAHADNLTMFDVRKFARSHAERQPNTEITMMVFETDTPQSCGIVELDNLGVVQSFHEKVANPPSNLANAAVYMFERSVVEWMESLEKKIVDLSMEVIPNYLARINTYHNKQYHRDIGTLVSWQEANREFPNRYAAEPQNIRAWDAVIPESESLFKQYLETTC